MWPGRHGEDDRAQMASWNGVMSPALETSLQGWASTLSYRSSFSVHVLIISMFILVQPAFVYVGFCNVELGTVTALANVPMIVWRCVLHQWADADAAQRIGAPSLVIYMLVKPSIILGLCFQLFGIGALPRMTEELVRMMESAAPLLLMADGLMVASLGLSRRTLIAVMMVNCASLFFGTKFAVVYFLESGRPTPIIPVIGLCAGTMIGHLFSSGFVERATRLEWDRRVRQSDARGRGVLGQGSPLVTKPVDETIATETIATLTATATESPLGSLSTPVVGASAGSRAHVQPLAHARSAHVPASDGSESTIEAFLREREEDGESMLSGFSGASHSTASALAEWEAAREEERTDERMRELRALLEAQMADIRRDADLPRSESAPSKSKED
jgi:hypothetical protein